MKDNKGGVTLVTIIIACVITAVLILGGIYLMLSRLDITADIEQPSSNVDTYKSAESIAANTKIEENKNVITTFENTKKTYAYSEMKGRYTYTTENKDGIYVGYNLELFENGTFHYRYFVDNDNGVIGNYTIVDDTIILNKLFGHGSDAGLFVTKGQIRLKINNNDTIVDNNNLLKDVNFEQSTVILKRDTSKYEISTIEEMLDTCLLQNSKGMIEENN